MIAALDLTSEASGEPILFEKIRERSGLAKGESAAQLAALTKLVKKQEFGHLNWPFGYEYSNREGRGLYRMTADVAAAWKAVRGR